MKILTSKTNILLLSLMLVGFLFSQAQGVYASCPLCPQFNCAQGDLELLTLKNRTQATPNWQDPISANQGERVAFAVYYHNCVEGTTVTNTRIRIDFPDYNVSNIVTTGYLWGDNASYVSDTGTINVSSAQRLTFDSTAKWYPNQTNTNPTIIPVTINPTSVEVNIGSIQGGWAYQGYVVFEATLSQSQAPTVDLRANGYDGSTNINYNTAATLSWTSTNATQCNASGDWSGTKATSGSESTGNLTSSKSYTITCTGPGGTVSDSVTVNVNQSVPTVDLRVNGYDSYVNINYNTAATLSWTSTNATQCTASNGWSGYRSTSGSESTGYLTGSRTYTLTCTGSGGSASDSVTVNVGQSVPTVDLRINGYDGSASVNYNTYATLSWNSTNATQCTASNNWSGYKATSGSELTGNLTTTLTYTLTCTGSGGSASDSVTAYVSTPSTGNLIVNKTVKNLSDGTNFMEVVNADPNEVLTYSIQVTAGNTNVSDVYVKDTLPAKILFQGNLKVDNVSTVGNIATGLYLGTINAGQTKTITFDATALGTDQYVYGTTELVNTAMAYNTQIAVTDTSKVLVTRTAVAGATDISTGINPWLIVLIVSLVLALGFYFLVTNLENSQNPAIKRALRTIYKLQSFIKS